MIQHSRATRPVINLHVAFVGAELGNCDDVVVGICNCDGVGVRKCNDVVLGICDCDSVGVGNCNGARVGICDCDGVGVGKCDGARVGTCDCDGVGVGNCDGPGVGTCDCDGALDGGQTLVPHEAPKQKSIYEAKFIFHLQRFWSNADEVPLNM